MNRPKLICCNFIPETKELKNFALEHGFDGVDWTFNSENLPQNPMQESLAVKTIAALHPLEVRYHCAFNKTDLGDVDSKKAMRRSKYSGASVSSSPNLGASSSPFMWASV